MHAGQSALRPPGPPGGRLGLRARFFFLKKPNKQTKKQTKKRTEERTDERANQQTNKLRGPLLHAPLARCGASLLAMHVLLGNISDATARGASSRSSSTRISGALQFPRRNTHGASCVVQAMHRGSATSTRSPRLCRSCFLFVFLPPLGSLDQTVWLGGMCGAKLYPGPTK